MAASTRNFAELCCHYGISLKRGYKWRTRFIDQGSAGLAIASRRPHTSPGRTPANMEAQVLAVRQAHPAWGGRKIAAYFEQQRTAPLCVRGCECVREEG